VSLIGRLLISYVGPPLCPLPVTLPNIGQRLHIGIVDSVIERADFLPLASPAPFLEHLSGPSPSFPPAKVPSSPRVEISTASRSGNCRSRFLSSADCSFLDLFLSFSSSSAVIRAQAFVANHPTLVLLDPLCPLRSRGRYSCLASPTFMPRDRSDFFRSDLGVFFSSSSPPGPFFRLIADPDYCPQRSVEETVVIFSSQIAMIALFSPSLPV